MDRQSRDESALRDPRVVATSLLHRFDEAHRALVGTLGDLLTSGVASAAEVVDAIGVEALERHLPSVLRVRLLTAALQQGRAGEPFDDEALLAVVSPALLGAHLPLTVLHEAVKKLCQPSAQAAPAPRADADGDDLEALGEDDEMTVAIDSSRSKALLEGLPDATLATGRGG